MGAGKPIGSVALGDDRWAQLVMIDDWSSTDGTYEDGRPRLRATILDLYVCGGGGNTREAMVSLAASLRGLADLVDKYTPDD